MKKALAAVVLFSYLAMNASPSYAWCYTWYNRVVQAGRGATYAMMSVDDYLPWNSGGSAKAVGMGGAFTAVANDLGGAVEYNPAGLTYLKTLNIGTLGIAKRSNTIDAQGNKKAKWTIAPTYAGAALKIGHFALGLSRKQPESTSSYQKFKSLQSNILAPDGYRMTYNTLSDKFDTSGLNTYVVTGAIKISRLSLGTNFNIIKGDIKRTQRGRTFNSNKRFDSTETVSFDGYTVDVGALMDMGPLRLGASARNLKGAVDVVRSISWYDNVGFNGNGVVLNWASTSTKERKEQFPRTYSAGAAILLGKILTVDLDYVVTDGRDANKALGRLGAELAVIPGFLFARGGVRSDFKNLVQDQNQKTMEYFVGAGLKLAMLTVDASASLIQAKAGADGGDMTGSVGATLKF